MRRLLAAGFVTLAGAAVCLAHDTWLSPSSYSAAAGESVSFALTSGMEFPKLDSAIKPERVARAGFRLGAETGELKEFKAAERSLRFEQSFTRAGVATVWLQLGARDIELTDEDVAHYFEEIRAPREVEEAWARQKGKEKWKELYTKCAKTFVSIGNSTADDSWQTPVGVTLEIIPLQNPTTIKAGATAKFRLLRNGEPLPNAALVLQNGGAKPSYEWTTPEGVATFQLRNPGPAMITSVHLRPPDQGKPWESEFTTITFEVKEE
jgi:hypothetical protein